MNSKVIHKGKQVSELTWARWIVELLTQCTHRNGLSKRKAITKIFLLNKLSVFISVFFSTQWWQKEQESLCSRPLKMSVSCVHSVQHFLNLISSLCFIPWGTTLCKFSREGPIYLLCVYSGPQGVENSGKLCSWTSLLTVVTHRQ